MLPEWRYEHHNEHAVRERMTRLEVVEDGEFPLGADEKEKRLKDQWDQQCEELAQELKKLGIGAVNVAVSRGQALLA